MLTVKGRFKKALWPEFVKEPGFAGMQAVKKVCAPENLKNKAVQKVMETLAFNQNFQGFTS